MHTHTIDLTTSTHTCLLCDEAAQPHSRFCSSCATSPPDAPTCPCGAELQGHGSYCSSACAEIHGRDRRVVEMELSEVESTDSTTPLDIIDADDIDLIIAKPSAKTPAQKLKETLASDIASTKKATKRRAVHTCTFCTNSTKGKCRCGRLLCGPCADDETGLCPHCADDAE